MGTRESRESSCDSRDSCPYDMSNCFEICNGDRECIDICESGKDHARYDNCEQRCYSDETCIEKCRNQDAIHNEAIIKCPFTVDDSFKCMTQCSSKSCMEKCLEKGEFCKRIVNPDVFSITELVCDFERKKCELHKFNYDHPMIENKSGFPNGCRRATDLEIVKGSPPIICEVLSSDSLQCRIAKSQFNGIQNKIFGDMTRSTSTIANHILLKQVEENLEHCSEIQHSSKNLSFRIETISSRLSFSQTRKLTKQKTDSFKIIEELEEKRNKIIELDKDSHVLEHYEVIEDLVSDSDNITSDSNVSFIDPKTVQHYLDKKSRRVIKFYNVTIDVPKNITLNSFFSFPIHFEPYRAMQYFTNQTIKLTDSFHCVVKTIEIYKYINEKLHKIVLDTDLFVPLSKLYFNLSFDDYLIVFEMTQDLENELLVRAGKIEYDVYDLELFEEVVL